MYIIEEAYSGMPVCINCIMYFSLTQKQNNMDHPKVVHIIVRFIHMTF